MNYTYEQAIEALKSCVTLEDFDKLILDTSTNITTASSNSTYLLYRGELKNGGYSSDIAEELAKKYDTVFRIQYVAESNAHGFQLFFLA